MTNNQHGQVPEALIDLIDAYAETRHRCGGIYNARTEAARNAVIEALSGVQALSAAPEAIAKLRHLYANLKNGAVRDTASAKRIAEGLLAPAIESLERAAPPAEQTSITLETGNSVSAQGAAITSESGAVYAELPDFDSGDEPIWEAIFRWANATRGSDAHKKADAVSGAVINALRDFADRTHALRMQTAPKAAPQPAPATQQAGDVVAYLDVGAGGYLDLGSELSEDALQQLPKGRHALVIAGTYGIDGYVAAPQPSPAAQADSVPAIQGEMNVQLGCGAEPPGIQALMCVISSLRDIAHFSDEEGGELMSALCALRDWAYAQTVAAPQPAPAPLSDDTERLEWLLWKLPGDALRYVVGELADTSSGAEFRAAIDAALAAQGGKT